jgi:hypothetical protein
MGKGLSPLQWFILNEAYKKSIVSNADILGHLCTYNNKVYVSFFTASTICLLITDFVWCMFMRI